EGNDGFVAVDVQNVVHGLTPFSSSHFLMLATAPLSTSGQGWGLCWTRTCSIRNVATLEPSRFVTKFCEKIQQVEPFNSCWGRSRKDQLEGFEMPRIRAINDTKI